MKFKESLFQPFFADDVKADDLKADAFREKTSSELKLL